MHLKTTNTLDTFTYNLPSCPTQISALEKFISEVTCNCSFSKSKYADILVSITEAVNNAIIHGNNKDKTKFVKISFTHNNDKLTFVISDEGNGFDPNELEDPTSPERIAECGGRGVFIMKQLCDHLAYHDNGRSVTMEFLLASNYPNH